MRNTFATIELVETFLYRSHKLNTLSDLLQRAVIRERSNGFKYDFFLSHGLIMRLTTRWVNILQKGS